MFHKLTLFRSTLTIVVSAFAVLSVFLAGTAYWVANQSHYHLQRSSAAHQVHTEYLHLSLETYRLFKQLINVLIAKDHVVVTEVDKQAIRDKLDRLRTFHATEIAIAQDHDEAVEQDELVLLARIEAQIQKILAELERASLLRVTGSLDEAQRRLIHTLEHGIDVEFADLVRQAVQRERSQVRTAEQEANELVQRYSRVTEGTAILMLGIAGLFVIITRIRLWRPLLLISDATQRLKHGDLAHRVTIAGNDEFAAIGHEFNSMACALMEERQRLEVAKMDLERTVLERTNELRMANKRLEDVDQHRRQFFADISHELRTPLTLIKGESQFALRGAVKRSEEYQETLGRINEQAESLTRLVDELLFIARTTDGAVHLTLEPVSLDRLLEHVAEDANLVARDQNIHVRFDNRLHGLKLAVDKEKLRQLFMILLMNAIRYSRPNGDVTMALYKGRDTAIVEVIDEGIGIPKEDIDGIFERFYRAANARAANTEGAGLGLPVARAIVLAHYGSISVQSEVGKGTTLTVSLPMTRNPKAAT